MVVARLRQAEQRLQQPMHAGRVKQVASAHHIGHALRGIVDHDREVIAGRRLLARQDHVAPGGGIGSNGPGFAGGPGTGFDPARAARTRERGRMSSRSA